MYTYNIKNNGGAILYMDKLKKSLKAFVVCIVMFIVLTALVSLLMQTGVMPDGAAGICMYVVLCLCCFCAGVMSAGIFACRGILSGVCAAIIFIALVWCGIALYTKCFNIESLLDMTNLIPAAAGIIGGIIGSNTKK